jgi:hypothetical protein
MLLASGPRQAKASAEESSSFSTAQSREADIIDFPAS